MTCQNGFAHLNFGNHVALEDSIPVPIVQPVYPEDGQTAVEDAIPISVASSALSEIIHWTTSPDNLNMVAARSFVLGFWLNPIESRFKSLNQIADRCNVTRSALSKSLLCFKDRFTVAMSIGRLASSREVYRQAQLNALQNGSHASQVRKAESLVQAQTQTQDMDQSAKDRFPTLDRATDRIAELEEQLHQRPQTPVKPAPVTSASVWSPNARPFIC